MVLIYIMSDNLYDITDEENVNETKRNNELFKFFFILNVYFKKL